MRTCSTCRRTLPVTAFTPRHRPGRTDTYASACRECHAEKARQERAQKREQMGESLRAHVRQARRAGTQVKPETRLRLPPGGRCVRCALFGTKYTIVRKAVDTVPSRRIAVCKDCLTTYYQPRGLVEALYAGGNEVTL